MAFYLANELQCQLHPPNAHRVHWFQLIRLWQYLKYVSSCVQSLHFVAEYEDMSFHVGGHGLGSKPETVYSHTLPHILSDLRTPTRAENWFLIIAWKTQNTSKTSFLWFRKYNQVMRVQSSMKVTNQRLPDSLLIGDGPQTSVWTKAKGMSLLFELTENGTWWLLAKIYVS